MSDIGPSTYVQAHQEELIWTEQDVQIANEYLGKGFTHFRKVNRNELLCVVENTRLFDYAQAPKSFLADVSYNCYNMSLRVSVGGEAIAHEENILLGDCRDWVDVRFMAEEMVVRHMNKGLGARPSRPDLDTDAEWLATLEEIDEIDRLLED
jgi:hypothetical protein